MKKLFYFITISLMLLSLTSCGTFDTQRVNGYTLEKVDGGYAICKLSEDAKNNIEYTIPTSIDGKKIVQFGSSITHPMGAELYELKLGKIRKLIIPNEIKIVDQEITKPLLIETEAPISQIEGLLENTNDMHYFLSPIENLDVNYVEEENCIRGLVLEKKEDEAYKILYCYQNNVSIPDYIDNILVNEIGENAFYCAENISISGSIEIIGEEAFIGSSNITIKSNNNVKEIQDEAFYKCDIKDFTFNNSLEIIGNDAFAYSSLEYITLPASLKELGAGAFAYTENLTGLTMLESSVTEIPSYCFQCSNLSDKLILPNNITTINRNAFNRCKIEEIVLRSSIKKIGENAFANNDNLKEFTLPESYVETDANFIGDCNKLETLNLGGAYSFILDGSFNSLKTITVSEGNNYLIVKDGILCDVFGNILRCPAQLEIKEITINSSFSKYAFSGNKYLEKVTYNGPLLNDYSFENCTNLKTVILASNIDMIPNGCFKNCTNLENINLENIASIGNSAFANNTKIKELNLPNCDSIGDKAFENCMLERVYFSNKIINIGDSAFINNKNLTECDIKNATYYPNSFANTPLAKKYKID